MKKFSLLSKYLKKSKPVILSYKLLVGFYYYYFIVVVVVLNST